MIKVVKQSATVFQHTCTYPYASAACVIAEVAGTCYAKDIDEAKAVEFCKKLISKGHESPFEFYQIGFDILTSRAVSHELVRHRIASYMQESQRYVSYRDCLTVIKPSNLSESCMPIWTEAMESGWANYCKLLDAGAKKEDARTVLPNSTATRIRMTMNLRSFRNFLRLRTHPTAWSEMRVLSNLCAEAALLDTTILPLIEDVWHKG